MIDIDKCNHQQSGDKEKVDYGSRAWPIYHPGDQGEEACEQFHNVIEPLKQEFPDLIVDGCLVPGLSRDWDEMKKTIDTRILDAAPVNSTR